MNCDGGKVYMMCGPASDQTCASSTDASSDPKTGHQDLCVEGCYCPKDHALHEGRCIPRSSCPCTLHGKVYPSGHQVPNDCNTW